jgi:hypothetical protein
MPNERFLPRGVFAEAQTVGVSHISDVLGQERFEVPKSAATELGFSFVWLPTQDRRE